jgi:DNA-binding transcriptional LysR family regulator
MDRLLWMQCFVRAVETGSFSAVAREMGTGQPTISRHILALESHLGARLLHRSTRKLSLTPEGERYYTEAKAGLDTLAQAEANVRGEKDPAGLLRIACSVAIGVRHVMPLIKRFMDLYPRVEIDLQISDRYIDLVEEGVDFSIRVGNLKDSALRARRIGASERVLMASRDYLAARPAPRTPADLARHDCVLYTLLSSGDIWRLSSGDLKVKGRFRVNSLDGARQAVLDGYGIGYLPAWIVEEEVRAGLLVPVLRAQSAATAPFNIVYATSRYLPVRASMLMDFIAQAFAGEPALNEGSLARILAARGKQKRR